MGLGGWIFLHGLMGVSSRNKQTKAIKEQTKSNETIASLQRYEQRKTNEYNRKLEEEKTLQQSQWQEEQIYQNEAKRKNDLIITLMNQGKTLNEATKEVEIYLFNEKQNELYLKQQQEEQEIEYRQMRDKVIFNNGIKLLLGILLFPFLLILLAFLFTAFR